MLFWAMKRYRDALKVYLQTEITVQVTGTNHIPLFR